MTVDSLSARCCDSSDASDVFVACNCLSLLRPKCAHAWITLCVSKGEIILNADMLLLPGWIFVCSLCLFSFNMNFLCGWSRVCLVSPQLESLPPNPTPSFPFLFPWFSIDSSDVTSRLGLSPRDKSSMVKIRGGCLGLVLLRRIIFTEQK